VWIVRETLRLGEKVAIAVVVAVIFAELRTLISGGERLHTLQVSLIIMGALLLMLGAVGPGSTYDRRLSAVGQYWSQRAGVRDGDAPTGPVLTAGAVFVISGLIVLALGFVI
jgi:hypothetical protein